jgi:hypothetical protein
MTASPSGAWKKRVKVCGEPARPKSVRRTGVLTSTWPVAALCTSRVKICSVTMAERVVMVRPARVCGKVDIARASKALRGKIVLVEIQSFEA